MQRRLVLVVAAIAALGLLAAAPAAFAKTSKTDKAQNKVLKSQSKSLKSLRKSTKSAGSAIAALKVVAERGDANAKTVLNAAPAIIQGLTDLKAGLTAAGASIKTLASSQEYGYVQITSDVGGAQGFLVTPDIPDSAQQAQTSQQFVVPATATSITTQFGVRSGESDGDGVTPAANCGVTLIRGTNGTVQTSGAPPYTAVPTKSTLAATASSPFGLLGGTDVPITGPTLTVAGGDLYTVKLNCADLSVNPNDPSA
jgi:hypothetical protein